MKETKTFIAFVNYYRRFIRNFARPVSLLNKFTSKTFLFIKIVRTCSKLIFDDFSKNPILLLTLTENVCRNFVSSLNVGA